jgi:hypothetical protein
VVNPRVAAVAKSERDRGRLLKAFGAISFQQQKKKRGGVVDTQDNLVPIAAVIPVPAPVRASAPSVIEVRGFTWADIFWALGIWSVIVCLSPMIVFYMLMVA